MIRLDPHAVPPVLRGAGIVCESGVEHGAGMSRPGMSATVWPHGVTLAATAGRYAGPGRGTRTAPRCATG